MIASIALSLLLSTQTPCNGPAVTLSASPSYPTVRTDLTFTAVVSGGGGPYTYAWDVDGDGVDDRVSSQHQITARYDRQRDFSARLRVTDATGCSRVVTTDVRVAGPNILVIDNVTKGQQICGDDDNEFDPGERWRLRVPIRNIGLRTVDALAHFTVTEPDLWLRAPDSFGYRITTNPGLCGHSFVDISSSPALAITPATPDKHVLDEGRTAALPISGNFHFYGELVRSIAMSTNGYMIVNPEGMTGGDNQPNCGTSLHDPGKRMRVLHNDFEVTALRTKTQPICDRRSDVGAYKQPCTIFEWSGVQLVGTHGPRFDMQAIIYPESDEIVYQYHQRNWYPQAGAQAFGATIGLMNTTSPAYNYSCGPDTDVFPSRSACFFGPTLYMAADTKLRITKGAGEIANNVSYEGNVDGPEVHIPTSASCGQLMSLNYHASVDARSVSATPTRVTFNVSKNCNVVSNCPLPTQQIALRGGSFYNPQRSGVGLVSFVIPRPAPQLPVFFGTWFTGEPNRRPTWYTVIGDLDGNQVEAEIYRSNLYGPSYHLPSWPGHVGKAQISLLSRESFLFSYQFGYYGEYLGRSGAELMQHLFSGLSAAPTDITGHYYSGTEAENGWGQTYESFVSNGVAQQFMLSYLFDSTGYPRWTLASFADSQASGPASTYEVHCPGCAWIDFLPTGKFAGTQSRSFPNGFGNGTISTQFTLPAPLSGTWNRTNFPIVGLSAWPEAPASAATTSENTPDQ